jgi:predicted dehydrogenase
VKLAIAPDRFEFGYRLELEAFFAALREGRTPGPGPEDALETLRLALAVTKSWREKRLLIAQLSLKNNGIPRKTNS